MVLISLSAPIDHCLMRGNHLDGPEYSAGWGAMPADCHPNFKSMFKSMCSSDLLIH